VEFGSGTGAFTAAVASRLGSDSRFFAIEKNAAFVDIIRLRFPDLDIVHGSVETLPSLLAERGGGQVDSIISGLPWASLGPEVQHRILAVALDCLAPSGTLATFAYVHGFALPSAWKFRKLLKQHFTEVRVSRVIWFNLPPAFVYHCRK